MIWLEELQTRKKISRIFSAYENTFPPEERREKDQFLALLENPDCFIFAVKNEDAFVGYLILWKLDDFYFLEHFEVFDEFRNLNLGTQILAELQEKFGPIVLESEPANYNEMAERRLNFYAKNGFSIISENYIQPSYGDGKNALHLWLLANWIPENTNWIKEEIYTVVYS
jgi:ribosomal protein S18 acetylase RimI-like enzyme